MNPTVIVNQLSKTYKVPLREEGLKAALASLWKRQYRDVEAVRGVSFDLMEGETVGFLGPNGAGKTTTLKMLSGILHPTAGRAQVLGYTPWKRESGYLRKMAMIRGNRPLGVPGELTVMDAFRFQQRMYEVQDDLFRTTVAELADILNLHTLLPRQTRALSLGERMRCGLAWALLYRPRVLFLDEPTIGLDVQAALTMREFFAEYAARTKATVILTSHDMRDVQAMCKRVIIIDHGSVVYRGDIPGLQAKYGAEKRLKVSLASPITAETARTFGTVVARDDDSGLVFTLSISKSDVPETTARVLANCSVADLTVEDVPLETIIDRVYQERGAC